MLFLLSETEQECIRFKGDLLMQQHDISNIESAFFSSQKAAGEELAAKRLYWMEQLGQTTVNPASMPNPILPTSQSIQDAIN